MAEKKLFLATALMLACVATLPSVSASAQTHRAAPKAMTDSDVLAISSAGLDDELIIAKIHAAASTNFDTSAAGLSAMKSGGLSSTVIRYMIDPTQHRR